MARKITSNSGRVVYEQICPRCSGSGTEEVFGYMHGGFQPMAQLIKCRVCKGVGRIIDKGMRRF